MIRYSIALVLAVLPQAALAVCGGFDGPVAMGFDHGSWGEKWYVLAAILVGVAFISAMVMRQWRLMREMPAEEI